MMWIKTLGGVLLGTIISGCIFLTLLCLVLRCMRETIWELIKKKVAQTAYLLLQKQEGEDVLGIPNNVLSQPWEISQKQHLEIQHVRNCVNDYLSCFKNNHLVINPKARPRREYDWVHESVDLGTSARHQVWTLIVPKTSPEGNGLG